jgi:hypothetical protein
MLARLTFDGFLLPNQCRFQRALPARLSEGSPLFVNNEFLVHLQACCSITFCRKLSQVSEDFVNGSNSYTNA